METFRARCRHGDVIVMEGPCLGACALDAASHPMRTWQRCSSWTRPVSAAPLTYSATSTESAPADLLVTSTSQIQNCTPPNLATLDNSLCSWRPAIRVFPVNICLSNIFPELYAFQPCSGPLTMHMEASYSCVTGECFFRILCFYWITHYMDAPWTSGTSSDWFHGYPDCVAVFSLFQFFSSFVFVISFRFSFSVLGLLSLP